MKPLAEPAIAAVEDGQASRFVPENWKDVYFEWMYNIRDWCISRQLWWGHRIPAWHCGDCKDDDGGARDAGQVLALRIGEAQQDTDVLDTWFSSGLWPFSTLGLAGETADLARFIRRHC